jgi:hypothetical protein
MDLNKPHQNCCEPWRKAHNSGTDNEGYGSLLRANNHGTTTAGCIPEDIRFCPWCGASQTVTPSGERVMSKEFARGPFRAWLVERLGNKVIRLEGPVSIIKGRKGMELDPNVIKALTEWLAERSAHREE